MVSSSALAAERYCRWLTRRAGSNFSLSFRFLPREKREGMEAVYAYCRAVDDAVDREGVTEEQARRELQIWRRELAACEEGFPAHPIAVALRRVQNRFEIPTDLFRKLIAGAEMDLQPKRFRAFEELRLYCEHVASVVGRISVRVFGCEHPAAGRYADALGIAFQLTNILRDLKSDLERGRLYLPIEDLERFGLAESDLKTLAAEGRPHPRSTRVPSAEQNQEERNSRPRLGEAAPRQSHFQSLMMFECARARDYFRQAQEHCRESGEARQLLPARVMAAVYGGILREIERSPERVFSGRITIPKWKQLGLAARCLLTSSS